jgi:hypothetical protein
LTKTTVLPDKSLNKIGIDDCLFFDFVAGLVVVDPTPLLHQCMCLSSDGWRWAHPQRLKALVPRAPFSFGAGAGGAVLRAVAWSSLRAIMSADVRWPSIAFSASS